MDLIIIVNADAARMIIFFDDDCFFKIFLMYPCRGYCLLIIKEIIMILSEDKNIPV